MNMIAMIEKTRHRMQNDMSQVWGLGFGFSVYPSLPLSVRPSVRPSLPPFLPPSPPARPSRAHAVTRTPSQHSACTTLLQARAERAAAEDTILRILEQTTSGQLNGKPAA
jgi:hypothetical protein